MDLIDNISKTLKEDLSQEIKQESKLSIAEACFSIYVFQELKREFEEMYPDFKADRYSIKYEDGTEIKRSV